MVSISFIPEVVYKSNQDRCGLVVYIIRQLFGLSTAITFKRKGESECLVKQKARPKEQGIGHRQGKNWPPTRKIGLVDCLGV